ncbi:MAG: hypothetical protein KDA96_04235 [Planctomycetaceae bacterium]|nr:hypothetical protein [Planctomycetaceae bacterium]
MFVLFVAIAVFLLYPTLKPGSLHSTLPTGTTLTLTVPAFNAWTIWWNTDQLQHGFREYWHAPIFAPERGTFAFSEPQPITMILAPLMWLTGSPALTYKVYVLLSLVMNGVLAVCLSRRLQARLVPAVLTGFCVVLLPIVHQQIDVMQLIPVWTIIWMWLAFDRLCIRPGAAAAVQAGVAFGLMFWTSVHHALFASVLLCGPVVFLIRNVRNSRFWLSAGLALGIAAMLILPLLIPMKRFLHQHDFERSDELIQALSAKPMDYLNAPRNSLLPGLHPEESSRALFPGWTKLSLALMGILTGILRTRTRRLSLFLLVTGALAFALSLGVYLEAGTWNVWKILAENVPGLGHVRSVFRFAYFCQLPIVLLGAVALSRLWLIAHRFQHRILRAGAMLLVAGIGILAGCETPPARFVLVGVPTFQENADWLTFLRYRVRQDESILCLPFADGLSVRELDATTRWMYLQTAHGRRMLNGYSGFFPPSWFALQRQLKSGRETTDGTVIVDQMRRANCRFLVVRPHEYDIDRLLSELRFLIRTRLVHSGPSGVNIYEVSFVDGDQSLKAEPASP